MCPRYYFIIFNNNCPNWDFIIISCLLRFSYCLIHKIIMHINTLN